MLRFLKSFFGKTSEPAEQAPYKVETPAVTPIMIPPAPEPVKCGCGRSASGLCVGLHKLSQEEWAAHPDNPRAVTPPAEKPVAKKAAAKKAPAKKKAEGDKPAAKPAAMTATKKRTNKKTPG